ncbi:hypothetical protein UlMin_019209 [Ulmus minor]
MNRPGDGNCRSCHDPKSSDFRGRVASSFSVTGFDVHPGDWYCSAGNCGTHNFHNFVSKMECFRCNAPWDSF